ncbi:S16 family serine protease [Lysinibacillus sp. 54212]|uniref:S16 family serine protease n=1 Tax=Lysinibacillus sp. 54212 TaxID=3119829 RepID=UPI002FC7DAD2
MVKGGKGIDIKEMKYQNFPFVTTVFLYLTYLYYYLMDFISGFYLINVLFFMGIVFIIFLILIRKTSLSKRPFIVSILLSFLLFFYETPLFETYDRYNVYGYMEPEELVQGSGIFLLSVKIDNIMIDASERALRDELVNNRVQFYTIDPITNAAVYVSKNEAWLNLIGLRKEEFTRMKDNVNAYLNPSNEAVNEFFTRQHSVGNSAGLALVLSSLADNNEFQNNKQIGVTGAISRSGKVQEVGLIEEKVKISSESGLRYMIVPMVNLSQAMKVKKSIHSSIEIMGVDTVDEAVEYIEELNGN